MTKWVRAVALLAFASSTTPVRASPPVNLLPPNQLSRGTYEPFHVRSKSQTPDFAIHAKADSRIDFVVREHTYFPGGNTGWHSHPGPLFITVKTGQLTIFEYNDPACTRIVVNEGQGYVDTGHGHIAFNTRNDGLNEGVTVDVTVATAPVGQAFRSELPAPGPHCSF